MFNPSQQLFVVFFAIFWGISANVHPRWKAFAWTFVGSSARITRRVLWTLLLMNVVPVGYFAFALQRLASSGEQAIDTGSVLAGVIPAFAIFGFYRVWLSLLEFKPEWFYYRNHDEMTRLGKEYLMGIDPTAEERHLLRSRWWWRNTLFGVIYLVISMIPLAL